MITRRRRSCATLALVCTTSLAAPTLRAAVLPKLPAAIFTAPTCPATRRAPPSLAYQMAASRCVADVCGPVGPTPAPVFRPDHGLGERYRRLVQTYLSSTRGLAGEAERLRTARPLDRLPAPMTFDSPVSWWQNFDASTGYLDALPSWTTPTTTLNTSLRASMSGYARVLGLGDRALERLLTSQLTIRAGPSAAEARAFAERGLGDLEERVRVDRSPDFARVLVYFAVESSITASPWGDHLADERTIVLTRTTLASDYALAVGVHEAGHAVTRFAESSPLVERALAAIKAHLLRIDPSHAAAHAEEDWADYFSARLSGQNLACGWVGVTLRREGFDYLDVGAGDSHSPLFYRLLAIENAAGRRLPLTCRDAIDARAAEVCPSPNSAASDVPRH